jgi:hypothetical protein
VAKKKRRRGGAPRGGPPAAAARPSPDRRRLAIQRDARSQAEARRRRRINRLIRAGAVLGVLALIWVVLIYVHRLDPAERRLLAQAPTAASSAGCGPIRDIRPYPGGHDRTHIGSDPAVKTMPPLSTYPSIPPASGPHDPTPLGAGVYQTPPPIGRAIHSLEHSAVIVWYDPSLAGDPSLTAVQTFFGQKHEGDHVIVAPYNYPTEGTAGSLPSGTTMALVAWHHLRYCATPSLPVAFDFVHRFRFDVYQWGAYKGSAPERWAPI